MAVKSINPVENPKRDEKRRASSTPLYRYLRGYAIDPSLALQLDTAPVSQVVFKLPWEDLETGPKGDYLEVIDYDPVSKCFYEDVDLNDLGILAQDGLPPSEGTPQFHQQMVYAVARLTINNFERALGRPTLWSPSDKAKDPEDPNLDGFVRRLRIYPHALRVPNAYYSPAKKALLFGYFPALESNTDGKPVPGGMVFTCLSHDIIAHETTHALLDGLNRRFNRPTNKDMLAFHEAFADLVALFQHFTFREILEHQIALSRGDLSSQETLLSQLAGQFGRATGARGALRDAIGKYDTAAKTWKKHEPDPAEYNIFTEPHHLGSILVAAIFDAFLSIYSRRIADLLRIYTGGSGILEPGAIHPDLVKRLSGEAAKTADHVLSMCVRALDYCPPVDLSFGEYLRAIITADVDLVPEDDFNYRVAFVEAFRRRGIYPRDLRTLSVENLVWRRPHRDEFGPTPGLVELLGGLRHLARPEFYADDRASLFKRLGRERGRLKNELFSYLSEEVKAKQTQLAVEQNSIPAPKKNKKNIHREEIKETNDCEFLGLKIPRAGDLKFEVESLHFASRTGPDGDLLMQAIVHLIQDEIIEEGEYAGQRMVGGCTLVVDLKKSEIAYCIRKPITSKSRQSRQESFLNSTTGTSLWDTYFPIDDPGERKEPFAFLHHVGF